MGANTFNPATVERAIEVCYDQIADGVDICDELLEAFLEADAELDRSFAQAFLEHQGPQTEKRYAAEVATAEKRKARDRAYAAFKYAEKKAGALEKKLMGLQSINKSVQSAYSAVGVAER
jgi:hypothetical protein